MTKSLKIALFVLCSFWTGNFFAHSVQVAYCMNAAGELVLFVEHWHGTENPSSTTMSINYVIGGATTSSTGSPTGSYQNVPIGSLPGCVGMATPFASCAGSANSYNDWVEYNFGSVPCAVNIELIVLSGNTVFTQDCGGMYPATTGIITLPCPINQIFEPDQTVCSGDAFTSIDFEPQAGVTYNWVNDNPAIGVPASGTGDIGVFTPPVSSVDQVANFTVTYFLDPNDIFITTFTLTALASPVANFSVSGYCDGFDAAVEDLSTNANPSINSWSWDFGDGSAIVTTPNPGIHNFPGIGPYNVQLTVTNGVCTDDIIIVASGSPLPVPSFTSTSECEGTVTSFTDGSSIPAGTITGYEWDFTHNGAINSIVANPTYGYPASGPYTAELIVTSDQGCQDSIEVPVVVNPVPVAGFLFNEKCDYETTSFVNESSVAAPGNITDYSWDFGNTAGTSIAEDPLYAYGVAGTYTVTLTVTTNHGCIANATESINVYPKPTADYTFADVCLGNDVNFIDNSNGNGTIITEYCWDMDGNFTCDGTTANFDYQYGSFGVFNPLLIVTTQFNCEDTATYPLEIFEIPTPNFTWQNECENDAVTFTNTSITTTGVITDYLWDYGNSTIPNSVLENPSATYANEGEYFVSLEVTSVNGCVASVTNPISIYPTPVPSFLVADVCNGVITNFVDLSNVSNSFTSNSIVNWGWDLGVPGTGGGNVMFNGQNASYLYGAEGTYPVTLTVITNNLCTNSITIDATVHPNPVIDFSSPNPDGCAEWCADFVDNSTITIGSINSHYWEFNNGLVSIDQNPSSCFENTSLADVTYDVTLTAVSDQGCSSTMTNSDMIIVYPIPVADFIPSPPVSDIYNTTFDFIDNSTIADVYDWNVAGLESFTDQDIQYTFSDADSGTYEICLNVSTIHGCVHDTCNTVFIEGYSNLYVANAFTPDGDLVNDDFKPSLYGVLPTNYEFLVFNRWGELIFRTNNTDDAWDGTKSGTSGIVQQDVYVWKVKAVDKYTNEAIDLIGHVTLIK
ncbi:MAG: gliding motility-associated-like protein [Flavobacteriales bacterium]|jgi:gliding motility-associated-like protein